MKISPKSIKTLSDDKKSFFEMIVKIGKFYDGIKGCFNHFMRVFLKSFEMIFRNFNEENKKIGKTFNFNYHF